MRVLGQAVTETVPEFLGDSGPVERGAVGWGLTVGVRQD